VVSSKYSSDCQSVGNGENMRADITPELLKELVSYDPMTGEFHWKKSRSNRVAVGARAGSAVRRGKKVYRVININRQPEYEHRLAWLYMTGNWPEIEVDHRDGNSIDNKWANLREASKTQNAGNTRQRSNNTSGFKGVSFNKNAGKWAAQVMKIHLGLFDDPALAHAAYVSKAKELFGEFARAA
jgi:hypothetical protein